MSISKGRLTRKDATELFKDIIEADEPEVSGAPAHDPSLPKCPGCGRPTPTCEMTSYNKCEDCYIGMRPGGEYVPIRTMGD
jgi:hypothetical protein